MKREYLVLLLVLAGITGGTTIGMNIGFQRGNDVCNEKVKLTEQVCLELDKNVTKSRDTFRLRESFFGTTYCRVVDIEDPNTDEKYEAVIQKFLCDVDPHCRINYSLYNKYKIVCGFVKAEKE